jgi:hypothetical protein
LGDRFIAFIEWVTKKFFSTTLTDIRQRQTEALRIVTQQEKPPDLIRIWSVLAVAAGEVLTKVTAHGH